MDLTSLLTKILEKLQPYRNKSEGLIAFIQSKYSSDKDLERILSFLKDEVDRIKSTQIQNTQKITLHQIKEKEAEQQKRDLKEVDDLLQEIENG